MAFSGEFQLIGPAGSAGLRTWQYNSSSDSVGSCSASAYFNDVYDQIHAGDVLQLSGNDYTQWYKFTSANGVQPVTVEPIAGLGSVGSTTAYGLEAMVLNIDGGDAGTYKYFVPKNYRLIDAMVTVSTQGQGGDTVTVKDNGGAHAYTNAMSINVAEGVIVRATSLNQDFTNLLQGTDNLEVVTVKGGANPVSAFRLTLIVMPISV